MRLLAASARQPNTPLRLLVALHRLLSTATTTTSSSYDPTAQFLHPDHRRILSLPASLRQGALLALARLLKTSPRCHLALHAVSGSPSSTPLATRFAAAARLAESAPALRPFAAILLAAFLPEASADLLSWSSSTGSSARVRYGVLRLALHAFLAAGMAAEALHVLTCVRRSGNTPSLSALAALLRLLFRSGEVRAAWNVFEEMATRGPRPSLAIFNAMMLGFCHRGMLRVASGLLGVMERKFGIVPNACSYNILIKGHCVFGWSGNSFMLFEEMRMSGCEPTVVTYNILVDVLSHEGRMAEARKLFDEMDQVGIKANTITFNVLIDGYAKTGRMDEASAAFREMKVRGLVPDSCTFNILSAGAYKFGRGAQLVHDHEMSGSHMTTDGLDVLVCRLCWDDRLHDAQELLCSAIEWGVPISVAGFNALIAAYSKEGLHEAAFELYSTMNKLGLAPSTHTFNYMIMGLCNQGRLDEARLIVEHMVSKGYCLSTPFTIYLDASFRQDDVVGALKCWDDMDRIGLQPDFIAFSAFINGLCRLDYVNEAYAAFAEMATRGLVPNNITYNSIISAFCRAGNMAEALKLQQKMRQSGLVPDVYTSNILIDGLCREGKLKMVDNLLLEMCSNGLIPDTVTYNTIISAYCRAQDMNGAMDFMNKMFAAGCEPDIFSYNIWMHSLCSNHMLNQAGKILDELVALGCRPDSVTYNTLMDGICSDVLDRAMVLTGRLIKMAFKPNTITLNVFLSHFCKQGFGKRALMWAEKLREDSFVFDDATRNIIDWAKREMENDPHANNEDIDRCLFLEFLMLMTYETMHNSRSSKARHVPTDKGFDPASNNNMVKTLDTG
ncbi:hypothetical protein HU200_002647 [Digitaria exilis]|uniref:Pentatricopeptide repeat-containing protein n=1 Tax=Digitaria exilis TaxID=1010633 RepID=A0A835KVA7_9POAL|nr:hypothetical protein HU200_002647 [Digitaria exilis]